MHSYALSTEKALKKSNTPGPTSTLGTQILVLRLFSSKRKEMTLGLAQEIPKRSLKYLVGPETKEVL